MIAYHDFVSTTVKGKWYQGSTEESFEDAVQSANEWVKSNAISVLNVETVVLPNIEASTESGTADTKLETASGWASWHQFVRVWYNPAQSAK